MPDAAASSAIALPAEILSRLACPVCHAGLVQQAGAIRCSQCQRTYPVQDGIPVLIADRAILG
jgi:uncharacterized protein YbaR (Trm112 family)